MNCDPSCYLITDLEFLEAYFLLLDHQGRYRIYIKPSTWNYIFIIISTILDSNKCCRNYVETDVKWPKCPKLSSRAKNGRN